MFTQCYELALPPLTNTHTHTHIESTNYRDVKLGTFLRRVLGYRVTETRPQPHPIRGKEASAGREDHRKKVSPCIPVYCVSSRELTGSLMRTEGTLLSGIERSCCTDSKPTLTCYSLTHSISSLNDSNLNGLL